MLDVENVTIHNDQRKKDVVKDVSFKVHAGEDVYKRQHHRGL